MDSRLIKQLKLKRPDLFPGMDENEPIEAPPEVLPNRSVAQGNTAAPVPVPKITPEETQADKNMAGSTIDTGDLNIDNTPTAPQAPEVPQESPPSNRIKSPDEDPTMQGYAGDVNDNTLESAVSNLNPENTTEPIKPEETKKPEKPLSINSLDTEQEARIAAAGPNMGERAAAGAGGLSSVLREILARRGAKISGKDPATEVEQIRQSQARLEANVKDKEGLQRMLQEKLDARKFAEQQKALDREMIGKTLALKTQNAASTQAKNAALTESTLQKTAQAAASNDPNSPQSKAARDNWNKNHPDNSADETMSEAMLLKQAGTTTSAEGTQAKIASAESLAADKLKVAKELSDTRTKLMGQGINDRKDKVGTVNVNKVVDSTQKDLVKMDDTIASLQRGVDILNNPNALHSELASLKYGIARNLHGPGVVNQQDIKNVQGPGDIANIVDRLIDQKLLGRPFSEKDKASLDQLNTLILKDKDKLRDVYIKRREREAEGSDPRGGGGERFHYIITGEQRTPVQTPKNVVQSNIPAPDSEGKIIMLGPDGKKRRILASDRADALTEGYTDIK